MSKSWIYLLFSCSFELVWVTGFNIATEWWHWLIILCIITLDFFLLFKACEEIPLGTVYAIFAALGTIGTAVIDTLLFDVAFTSTKLFFLIILVIGIVSLKLADNKTDERIC